MGAKTVTEAESDWPIPVRRRDVHEEREHRVRTGLALFVDIVLHLCVAVVVMGNYLEAHLDGAFWVVLLVGAVTYAAVSFAHRVLVQCWWQTTLGKALFGLRVVRGDTRGRVPLWALTRFWLLGTLVVLMQLGSAF